MINRKTWATQGYFLFITMLSLAMCATFASLNNVRVFNCVDDRPTAANSIVDRLTAQCHSGLLQAGFPMLIVHDAAGESPTSSWGKIDANDLVNIHLTAFVGNVLFYVMLLWLSWWAVWAAYLAVRRRRRAVFHV